MHFCPRDSPCDADVTRDGSPVEVYRRLPPLGEPELIAAAVPPGSEMLELGCGAGRLTHPLVDLGYRVTVVDESAAMLSYVSGAATVRADIKRLSLGRRFDAVLLASHFVNVPDAAERAVLLGVCAAHVAADGSVLAEAYPPDFDWDAAVGRERIHGGVAIRVAAAHRVGTRVAATMEYRVGELCWEQAFEAELLDEGALRSTLVASGLRFARWLDRARGWFEARLAS